MIIKTMIEDGKQGPVCCSVEKMRDAMAMTDQPSCIEIKSMLTVEIDELSRYSFCIHVRFHDHESVYSKAFEDESGIKSCHPRWYSESVYLECFVAHCLADLYCMIAMSNNGSKSVKTWRRQEYAATHMQPLYNA